MQIRFDQPEWLWLLIVLIPMSAALLRWCVTMSLLRRWTAVLVRAALVLAIVAMLAGASSVRTTARLAVLAIVDVSGSVRGFAGGKGDGPTLDAARRWLATATATRGPEDLLGMIAFDGRSAVVATPRPPAREEGERVEAWFDRALEKEPSDGTDLAAAIRLALTAFPPDAARRAVLFSDGVPTRGDALAASREAAGGSAGDAAAGSAEGVDRLVRGPERVAIDVLPIEYDVAREVSVETVDAPTRAPADAAITVRVAIRSTGAARGTLRLYHEEREVDLGRGAGAGLGVELAAGMNSIAAPVTLSGSRVHRFRAVFEPEAGEAGGDTISANNSGEAITVTPGRGAVLIVDGVGRGDPRGEGSTLLRTLRGEGIEAQMVAPEGLPVDMLRLQEFDLVVLQNVAADTLGEAGQERLKRYVTELGGGLVMIGGPDSFAAGGYRGSILEPILPVKLDLPERLVVPATAVVIVLDCSGSMGFRVMGSSRSQQDVANEGAALAVRSLDKTDLVGVIKFDNAMQVVVPLSRNTDSKATAEKIMGIRPDGGTNMPPAIVEAHRQLKAVDAKIKHVIALTDGVSQGKSRLAGLGRALAADGIKLTTIAVGDGADTEGLAAMADAAGGRYYRVVDPNVLPRVFLRAVRVVRTPLVREEPFTPIVIDATSPLLDGVISGQSGAMPALGGIALTQARDEPTAVLVLSTSTGEPVLASWQAGLGQVAAFTSDAHDRWASAWLGWPGYRALWTRIVRQISRPTAQRTAELSAEVEGDELRVRLDASDDAGRPMDGLSVPAGVYSPRGDRIDVTLSQVAPGAYEGSVRVSEPGGYVVTVSPRAGERPLAPVVGGVTKPAGLEYRTLRSDRGLLEQVARLTGGRVLDWSDPAGARLFDRSQTQAREARTPLWPFLLPWALVLAVVDVAVRRLAWDRLLSTRFGEGLRRHAERMVRDRGARAATAAGQLRRVGEALAAREAPVPSAQLSTDDARRIVLERRRERAARAKQSARDTSIQPGAEKREPPAPTRDEPSPEGGLAAAKRRARERFEGE
ncbi:MAG: VWA domain-containing protein [Phycisphaerales bacterium]